MSPKTLFLVDDEPSISVSIARALRRTLEPLGVRIKTFQNPADALEEIKSNGLPDAVMTDDLMPFMSGREFAKELRARGFIGKILMLSGTAHDDVLDCGVDRLMTKPFSLADLRETFTRIFT